MSFDAGLLSRMVWFFDYDGSVCPHLEVWEERNYDPLEIYRWIKQLSLKSRGLYWNTGRRPESLAGVHEGFREFPGYYVQGSVWCGRNAEPELIGPLLDPKVGEGYVALLSGHPHLRLEIKKTGLRLAPVPPKNLRRLKTFLKKHGENVPPGWAWQLGHRGAEMLALGFDKAMALRREMKNFPKDSIPVVVGDDSLDRPAFEEALKLGGYVIPVGDDCGWITELPHRPNQIVFCENPAKVQQLAERLIATAK